jgi:G3E family GTPase
LEKGLDLDYILIEANGMAHPGPIASVFWLDDVLELRLQLDGIVTLVDAYHIVGQLQHTKEAAQQIAYADDLINKVDLLTTDDNIQKGQSLLQTLHPTAPMQATTYLQVPNLDWILNANCSGGSDRLDELDTIWNQA